MKNTQELASCTQNNQQKGQSINSIRLNGLSSLLTDPTYSSCVMGNQGFLICIDKKCMNQNPFICYSKNCKCLQIHKKCDQKRIDAIQQIMQQKMQQQKTTKQQISAMFQSITDQLSNFCDKIIFKLQQSYQTGEGNKNLHQSSTTPHKTIQLNEMQKSLINKSLTGSQVHKVFNSIKLTKDQSQHEQIMQQLKKRVQQFKQKDINSFTHSIEQILKRKTSNNFISFSQTLIHPNLIVQKNTLKNSNKSTNRLLSNKIQVALIEPSVNLMHFNYPMHSWKLKIINADGDIRIGCGKKSIIQKYQYAFDKRQKSVQSGCVLFTLQQFKNVDTKNSPKFCNNDIIDIEFSRQSQRIYFDHKRLNINQSVKVNYSLQDYQDDYYFMIGLDKQAEVQILHQQAKKQNRFQNSRNKNVFKHAYSSQSQNVKLMRQYSQQLPKNQKNIYL